MTTPDDLDDPPKRPLRLHAVGGLANRLRAILPRRPVDVIWDADEYVSRAKWSDVFEPLDGVRFVEGGWDVEDYAPSKGAPKEWERGYLELKMTPKVAYEVAQRTNALGSYVAIHVRRTDMLPLLESEGKPVEPLENFINWAEGWSTLPVYVASDNGETQAELCRLIGPRSRVFVSLPGAERQGLVDHSRNGTLVDAVVDLVVCAGARAFRGTKHSSFTDLIETIRRLHDRAHI